MKYWEDCAHDDIVVVVVETAKELQCMNWEVHVMMKLEVVPTRWWWSLGNYEGNNDELSIFNIFQVDIVHLYPPFNSHFYKIFFEKGSKKKLWKSGQADRLGWPPSPLPRSGQENVKISRQVAIFGVILSFYNGQKWVKIFTNRSGQAEGGWPPLPPPKRSAWPLFTVFF